MNDVLIGAGIIAVVEFIKRLVARFPKLPQISGNGTILLCTLLGAIAGLLQLGGLNVTTGIMVGLGATGTHQVASAVGGK
jgi:hypothetical protein